MCLGAYSIAAQIYFIRELLVIFFGNELCLGIIFGGWFAGITGGAAFGNRLLKKLPAVFEAFLACLIITCLLPFVLIIEMRMLQGIFDLPPGSYAALGDVAVGTIMCVCPFSFMIGLLFPLGCQVLMGSGGTGSLEIGWVYVWESVGSLISGLCISLVLLPRYSPFLVFAWGSLIISTGAFVLTCIVSQGWTAKLSKAVLFVLCAASIWGIVSSGCDLLETSMTRARWKSFKNNLTLIATKNSRYQHLVLAEGQGQYSIYANGRFVGIYPDEHQSAFKAHFFLCQHPSPGKILLIGSAMTGLLREMLKHPVETIDYVELDPALVNMVYPVLHEPDKTAFNDKRVSAVYVDGRAFVKRTARTYDMIIVCVPDPATALINRYYTVDFFQEVKTKLARNGIFITGMSSTAHYISREHADYNGSLYKALMHVFPSVMAVPGERNYFFAALSDEILTREPAVLTERYERRTIDSSVFSPAFFRWLLRKDRRAFFNRELKRKSGGLLNTDFRPVTFFYNLVIWEMLARETKSTFLTAYAMKSKGVWWLLVGAACIVALYAWMCTVFQTPQRFARFSCFYAIATTGFTGMAMEIILIFVFQSVYGYIFEKIGIIIAACMLGLAAGGFLIRCRHKNAWHGGLQSLAAIECIVCVYALAIPFILSMFAGFTGMVSGLTELSYFFLVFFLGLLVGLEFPLAGQILISMGHKGGQVAAWIDAMDHVGACLGAFLIGALIMPLFGIYQTCFMIVFLKLVSITLLFIGERRIAG